MDEEGRQLAQLIEQHVVLDTLLGTHQSQLGGDATAYRNHCYRVLNFCVALRGDDAERDKIAIALAFHDIGIWTHGTLDYLAPSCELARDYLDQHDLSDWRDEVEAMIDYHHKMSSAEKAGGPLVEHFRQADWIDVSGGMLRFGLPRAYIRAVKHRFPNAGFHRRLVQLGGRRFLRHPFSPLPMFRI